MLQGMHEKLLNFLSCQVGYGKSNVTFMPISAQTTVGFKARVPKDLAPCAPRMSR